MDMQALLRRQRADILEGFSKKDLFHQQRMANATLSRLIPGSTEGALRLEGVNYASEDRADWGISQHYRPISLLATLANVTEDEEERARYLDACQGLLLEWVHGGYTCPNWWYNVIDMPVYMGAVLVLIGDKLPEELFARCMQVLSLGSIVDDPSIELNHKGGANFLWVAAATMNQALLRGSEEELAHIARRVEEVALLYDEAGFQEDDSFFQHGPRLYSCGYGRSFVIFLSKILYTLRGTPYQLPTEKLMLLSRHILEGIRYMTHKSFADYAASGREYVRPRALHLHELIQPLDRLSRIPEIPRKEEIATFAEELKNRTSTDLGIKYFPKAKLLVSHIDGIYISFRGGDDKTVDSEIINRENPLGYNLSYGTHTTVMQNGKEYSDIAPLWNYSQIPGTTAYHESDEELLSRPDFSYRTLPLRYFGGTSEAGVGICYLKTEHEGTRATVSAFATPYGTAILGCELENDEGRPLVTTVEQCHLVAECKEIEGTVLHGKVAYRSLDEKAPLTHFIENRQGSFARQRLGTADVLTEGTVLTVLVDRAPDYDKYAYLITTEALSDADFEVLRNDGEVQAIRTPDGRILAVFYKDCDLTVDGCYYHGEENSAKIF